MRVHCCNFLLNSRKSINDNQLISKNVYQKHSEDDTSLVVDRDRE